MIDEDSENHSFWQDVEESILEEFDEVPNPFANRVVGISKKTQDREQGQWWKGTVCPSCKKGFNSKSSGKQCHSCDRYTHVRNACISKGQEVSIFL